MLKGRITTRSLQEVAPWATPVTDKLVFDKDGSLLTQLEFEGIDADSPSKGDISALRDNLDAACKNFDHRITAWWRLSHRRIKTGLEGTFSSESDARIDEINQQQLSSGKFFRNQQSLALAYTPESGIDKVFEKLSYHMKVGSKPLPLAILETVKDLVMSRSALAFDLIKMRDDIKRFESIMDAFLGGVTRLKCRRLEMQHMLAHLHQTANPSVPPRRIRYPLTMLDSHLTESKISIGANMMEFKSAYGVKYAKVIGVKEWLGFQEAALDVLNQIDGELDINLMFRFLNTSRAEAYVKKIRGFYKVAAFNPWDIIKGFFSKEEQKNDKGRVMLAEEAEDALARMMKDGQQYGYANISVVVYGDTPEQCDDLTREVVGRIGNAGFGVILEENNMFASWASTLPGQWREQKRLQFVETPAMSDLAPIRGVIDGGEVNDWLTSQNPTGEKVGPLTCLPTRHKTLQRVNLHHPGGKSHVLVIGPIGAGKSVLLNFLVSQTGRHGARRIRFDKDRSTRITTVMGGGNFIDVTGRFKASTHVNPLSLLSDRKNYTYVAEWVQMAIEGDTYSCTKADEKNIFEAVTTLAGYSREMWTLSFLNTLLPAELRERLGVWTKGEKNGHFFDHVEDAFALSDDISIEMGDLFQNYPVAAGLFMDYAFKRIELWLTGRYTVIEIEEGGFFFQYEKFYRRLEVWTVTIRKLNGTIVIATQSLKQLERIKDFEVLKENIPNIIYLPNADAKNNKHLYCDVFGLTDTQVEMISEAVPNRDYLWVTTTQTRMLQAQFPKEMLAYLRSDGRAQEVLDKHYESGAPDWRQNYVNEIVGMN
jgi:type IV secretion/conjugal transfer VirB4 family ATPase